MNSNLVANLSNLQIHGIFDKMSIVNPELYCSTKIQKRISTLSSILCVCFNRKGTIVFTGSFDGILNEWCCMNGTLLLTLKGHQDGITDIDINNDYSILASGSFDQTIRIWSLKTNDCITILHEHTQMVSQVKFWPISRNEQQCLVSMGNDGLICFWNWNHDFSFNKTSIREKQHADKELFCISFSVCGFFLAVASDQNTIAIYELHNNIPIRSSELKNHSEKIESIQFANYSSRFLSGSGDGTINIWSYNEKQWNTIVLDASKTLQTRKGDYDDVFFVRWNCDDSLIISAQINDVIKIWDSRGLNLMHEIINHQSQILSLQAHPCDPRLLLSAEADGQIIISNILKGEIIKKFNNSDESDRREYDYHEAIWVPNVEMFIVYNQNFLDIYGFAKGE
jgi:bromodomain and WD repeat domain-containing protein 1/3